MVDAPAAAVAAPPRDASPIAAARALRLVVAYDGTAYHGWQIQPGVPTIQGLLVGAAHRVLGEDARVIGASRTDAGVHARGQGVSITTTSALAVRAVQSALNAALPADVRVLSAIDADPGFDARRSAVGKRYAYLLDTADVPDPLLCRFAWHVPARLDVEAARAALGLARGRHDFSAFCAAAGRDADPTCVLRAVHVVRRRSRVALFFSGDRFLHHMVRNLVGSAVAVARGAHPVTWLGEVLASRDRSRAGVTAPAHGLMLLRVLYRQ